MSSEMSSEAISEIYGLGDRAAARRSDPDTSHDAAASVGDTSHLQRLILALLATPKHDAALIAVLRGRFVQERWVRWSDSSIRSRRAELVKMGEVKDSGRRVTLLTGRQSIVWCLA
jgi:hypothetical protein